MPCAQPGRHCLPAQGIGEEGVRQGLLGSSVILLYNISAGSQVLQAGMNALCTHLAHLIVPQMS